MPEVKWRKVRQVMCRGADGRPVEVETGLVDIDDHLSVPVMRIGICVVLDETLSAGIVTNIRHTMNDWLQERRKSQP